MGSAVIVELIIAIMTLGLKYLKVKEVKAEDFMKEFDLLVDEFNKKRAIYLPKVE